MTRTVIQASGCDVMNCVSRSYTFATEESIGHPCNGVIKTHNTRLHAVQMTTRCTYRGRDGCANDEDVLTGVEMAVLMTKMYLQGSRWLC